MKKSQILRAVCVFMSIFTAPQAMSQVIDTYFGWNYVDSAVDLGSGYQQLPGLDLYSITYTGGDSGTTIITQNMNFGVSGAMPDGVGLATKPTNTYTLGGDGESTRTQSTSLPIDWTLAGTTPWGTYAFPTIKITDVFASGVPGFTSGSGYIVGLIPYGVNTELDSSLGGFQSDIYDSSRQGLFIADPLVIDASGYLIFSAASAVPVPAAVWLFGSGLIGLIGMARRKKA